MKIGSNPVQAFLKAATEKPKTVQYNPIQTQLSEDPKKTARETILKHISALEAARNDKGEDDPKAQQLIEKFKSGKMLTADEMNYIRKNAPGMVEYIERISRERKMWELGMKLAPSKLDVDMSIYQNAQNIEKNYNGEERLIRMKHLADAAAEYKKTDEYKEKPNTVLEGINEEMANKKKKKRDTTEATKAIYSSIQAYEKIKATVNEAIANKKPTSSTNADIKSTTTSKNEYV